MTRQTDLAINTYKDGLVVPPRSLIGRHVKEGSCLCQDVANEAKPSENDQVQTTDRCHYDVTHAEIPDGSN